MSDGYVCCGGCDELRADKRDLEATIADLRERHESFVNAVRRLIWDELADLNQPTDILKNVCDLCDAELKGEAQ